MPIKEKNIKKLKRRVLKSVDQKRIVQKSVDQERSVLKENQENIKLFYFSQFLNSILLKNLISY